MWVRCSADVMSSLPTAWASMREDQAVLVLLVRHETLDEEGAQAAPGRRFASSRRQRSESVGQHAQLGDGRGQLAMLGLQTRAQVAPAGDPGGRARRRRVRARRALRMTMTSIASWTRAPATGGRKPAAATSMATNDRPIPMSTLWRAIVPRAAGDADGLGEPVEAVDGDDDVSRLRAGRRAAGAHGHAHVGGRERRRVVDAVTDHDQDARRASRRLAGHGIDLVGRGALRQHRVDADRRGRPCRPRRSGRR